VAQLHGECLLVAKQARTLFSSQIYCFIPESNLSDALMGGGIWHSGRAEDNPEEEPAAAAAERTYFGKSDAINMSA